MTHLQGISLCPMQQQIASYLFQHKSCFLPGLGTLSVNTSEAVSDFTNKVFTAPKPAIEFANEVTDNNGLADYVSAITGTSKAQAMEALNHFCLGIKQKAETGQQVLLDQIGSFFVDTSGMIGFSQQELPAAFVQSVFAERVIHPDAAHQILVGDKETTSTVMTELLAPKEVAKERWWIWAIVLGGLALLALLIYFTELNGSSPFGNIIKI